MSKLKIAVLVSGGGTNLQAIIDKIASGEITNTEIALVFSNNRKAYALERAKMAGIPAKALSPKQFENREAFNDAVLEVIEESKADMRICGENLVNAFPHRIINIHPSLIPSFCGKGYYGLTVHEKALKRGVKVTGATVHFVDEVLDNGPIILQKAVMIEEGDTPEVLQRRVMEQAEWVILPKAIDLIANGKISVENGIAHIKE